PYDQFLHEKIPARQFPLVVRTRARNGARGEYFATVRFKKVDGDWYFDQAGMQHLRELPIRPDDPPEEAELKRLLSEGFSAAPGGARILKLTPGKYPDYDKGSWSYRLDVTFRGKEGKTQICPRAEAKIEHAAPGKSWKYL